MKKIGRLLLIAVLIIPFTSCVSMQDRQMTASEQAQAQIIGQVRTSFHTWSAGHSRNSADVRNRVYRELTRQAQLQYGGEIEVRNIRITGSFSGWQVPFTAAAVGGGVGGSLLIVEGENRFRDDTTDDTGLGFTLGGAFTLIGGGTFLIFNLTGNVQRIAATGDVVSLDGTHIVRREGIQGAVGAAVEVLAANMPRDSSVAVIGVESHIAEISQYVVDRLEHGLVGTGRFRMVSRTQLIAVRAEQGFHISGYVDDNSAVRIGRMLGANLVIAGSISGAGAHQRLTLRALDVETGQIVAMALENF